jgi:hypothetical protein
MQQTRVMGDSYKRLVMEFQDHLQENTKMNLTSTGHKGVDGIRLAQSRITWRGYVNTDPVRAGNFLTR